MTMMPKRIIFSWLFRIHALEQGNAKNGLAWYTVRFQWIWVILDIQTINDVLQVNFFLVGK